MILKLLFFLTLFYYKIDANSISNKTNEDLFETTTAPTSASKTTPSSQDDYLENISIEDVLSSDIDANEKIEKKIISAVTEYSSDYCVNSKIRLSMAGFIVPYSTTVDLGDAIEAIFLNTPLVESSSNDERKSYSSLIGCDSSRMAKIQVKLPTNIVISANLKIQKIANSTNRFYSSDRLDTGSISFTLIQNTLSKQSPIQSNNSTDYADNSISKILYNTSQVTLNIDTKFQMAIYNKLNIWFDQMESSISQYLIEKLETDLSHYGVSVANTCSKFLNPDKNLKKVNSPLFNTNFNNIYVIPDAKLETWKGVNLSAGPILIDGLSSFNSTELIVSESEASTPQEGRHYFTSIPPPEINTTTIRIKTNDLKGKVDWNYNSKKRSFPFTLEFIQFEVKKMKRFKYTMKHGENVYENGVGHYYPYGSYARSIESTNDVNVHLGNLQIKSSKSGVCENENEFVSFVLSEYLKTVIADSLKNSLSRRILNDSLFTNCA